MLYHPLQQLTSVDAIYPDAPQLLAAAHLAQPLEQHFGSCWVRKRGGSNHYSHQQAQCVHYHMTFAAFDTLVAIVATFTWSLACLGALAVQATGCGMLVSTNTASQLCSQLVMDTLPGAIISPPAEVVIDTLPLGIAAWQHTPLAATYYYVEDSVDNTSHFQSARPTAWLCGRNVLFDTLPLTVGQVGRVCLVAHTPSVSSVLPDRHPLTPFPDRLLDSSLRSE